MHGFPFLYRIACVLAERSRSAPQALGGTLAHNGCCRSLSHLLEPPGRCAPALAPAPAPSPPTVVFIYFRWLQPARMVALVDP
eukprot:1073733-Pleurochrysis_carterae.AAC.1